MKSDAEAVSWVAAAGGHGAVSIGVALAVIVGFVALLLHMRWRLRVAAQTERALRAAEERWKFALEGAGDGAWDADLAKGVSHYSPRWKAMLGHSDDEIGNAPHEWTSRIHPDDLSRVLEQNEACVRGAVDEFVAEFRMRTKDDRWIWVLDRARVVERSSAGRATRMIGTHTDITERKRAELRRAARGAVMTQAVSGEPVATMLASVADAVAAQGDWSCVVLAAHADGSLEAAGCQGLDRSWAGLLLGDHAMLASNILAGRRLVVQPPLSSALGGGFGQALVAQGHRCCWIEPVLAADGRPAGAIVAFHASAALPDRLEMEGVVDLAQILAIAMERRRAEAALRESRALLHATLDRMPQGVMMVASDGRVHVCNRRALELLDLPPALMESKPRFADVLEFQWATDEFRDTPEHIKQFVRGGGILDRPQAYERRRPNGTVIEVRSVPIERGGVLRTYTDITERVDAEEGRRRLEEQLLEARKLEAIGTLAGGIAHDFNNIVASILGNAALIAEELDETHPAAALLQQVRRAGNRARSLVRQILIFSRRDPLEFKALSLRRLVHEADELVRPLIGPSITLSVAAGETDAVVLGDATQLQQVLLNLCTNASYAIGTKAGSIRVGLELAGPPAIGATEGGAPAQRYAHLWVSDDGRGIGEAVRQRLFDPFFTTKPEGHGSGLGLAVCHGIVKTHGGLIEVESEIGRGSVFHVYLPLLDAALEEHHSQPGQLLDHSGRGERVLYVDDDECMVAMVDGLLRHLGYAPTSTTDPEKALQLLARNPGAFDAIVTDYNMPGVSGLEIAKAARRASEQVPIIVSTGMVSEGLRREAEDVGARLMRKEDTLEELQQMLRQLLGAAEPPVAARPPAAAAPVSGS